MDAEGYPTDEELERIRKWDVKDFVNLISFVEELHIYKDYMKREMITDRIFKRPILKWTFCTGGWSGNESLIYALLDNWMFKAMWYYSWERGGKYVFYIDPSQVGFELVSVYCTKNNLSRQWISKAKHKYDYFVLSPKRIYVREKLFNT